MLNLFILKCAAEECGANFHTVSYNSIIKLNYSIQPLNGHRNVALTLISKSRKVFTCVSTPFIHFKHIVPVVGVVTLNDVNGGQL